MYAYSKWISCLGTVIVLIRRIGLYSIGTGIFVYMLKRREESNRQCKCEKYTAKTKKKKN